ncbi:MAG: type II secretion system protein GspM [Burkholderiales bacterium]|nr:type II secretion system protein GspM [Burkholderiales bacterium]
MSLITKKLSSLNDLVLTKFEPQIKQLQKRWEQFLPRERYLLIAMIAALIVSLIYFIISGLISYKNNLDMIVGNLNKTVLYTEQAKYKIKQISKVDANKFNQVTVEQIKSDITQVAQVESPVVLIQDEQLSINIPNGQFSLVMTLLDQLHRSYGIFPDQVNITKQSQSGYVSMNAIFWVTK